MIVRSPVGGRSAARREEDEPGRSRRAPGGLRKRTLTKPPGGQGTRPDVWSIAPGRRELTRSATFRSASNSKSRRPAEQRRGRIGRAPVSTPEATSLLILRWIRAIHSIGGGIHKFFFKAVVRPRWICGSQRFRSSHATVRATHTLWAAPSAPSRLSSRPGRLWAAPSAPRISSRPAGELRGTREASVRTYRRLMASSSSLHDMTEQGEANHE